MKVRKYLARLKRRLLKKPILRDPKYAPYWFQKNLNGQAAYIVQIGSNDGKTGDPLHGLLLKNTTWKALFVEPVPYLYDELVNNYPSSQRFSFENVAINQGVGMDFFWVSKEAKTALKGLPFWFNQLGSFDRNHIVRGLGKRIVPYIQSRKLEGITLPTLLKRNNINHIDILHIDTEGYDWKILSQLDLKIYQPAFILFEKNHLEDHEIKEVKDFLNPDYHLFSIGIDGFAVHKKLAFDKNKQANKFLTLWNY